MDRRGRVLKRRCVLQPEQVWFHAGVKAEGDPARPSHILASLAAWAFFVACEMLPIFDGGTLVRLLRLGRGRMPSFGLSVFEGGV
jgi:hypothetical protein